jgi:preprotein translocase subunit YajC
MSTTDPDARAARVGAVLRPVALVGVAIGILIGPGIAFFDWFFPADVANGAIPFLVFVFVSVGAGILAYYVPGKRSALAIAAYIVAYVGGLFLVMSSAAVPFNPTKASDAATFRNAIIIVIVIYAVAIFLVVKYIQRDIDAKQTNATGISTTAIVTSAGVDGMVNYVQHQRLTLKFTDDKGVERWFKVGRTGGGYSVGDTLPIRYNPKYPGRTRAIVVGY